MEEEKHKKITKYMLVGIIFAIFIALISCSQESTIPEPESFLSEKECLEPKYPYPHKYASLEYFKNYEPECKDYQIIKCRQIDKTNPNYEDIEYFRIFMSKTNCFYNLAIYQNDEEICDYIEVRYGYSDYDYSQSYMWLCKAELAYGRSACSYIEDDYIFSMCLKHTEED